MKPIRRNARRAHAVVRSAILAVATLAVVGVLFAVYQYSTGVKPPPGDQRRISATPPTAGPGETDKSKRTVPVGEGQLGPGGRIRIVLYGADSNEAKGELLFPDWEPSADAEDELHIFEPEVRFRTPNGQQLRVTAHEGWVQVRGAEQPNQGRLVGNVTMEVDRLSEEQRAALPTDQRDQLDEDRLIHLEFQEIEFDLVESRLDANGPFSLQMAEASLEGKGLHVRYNEIDDRLELLLIDDLEQLVFLAPPGALDAAIPGTAATVVTSAPDAEDEPDSAQAEPVPPAPAAEAENEPELPAFTASDESDDIPLFVPDRRSEPEPLPPQTYRVEIDRDVSIRQRGGDEFAWNLEAPSVELVFDFGQRQREAARQGKVAEPGAPENDSGATDTSKTNAEQEIVVRCAGSFSLRPVEIDDHDETRTGDRLRLTAGDGDVYFTDGRSSVSCSRLVAQQDTGTIQLVGAPDDPVVINTADRSELVATEVLVDRSAGKARITGPARLVSRRSAHDPSIDTVGSVSPQEDMYIQFDDPADLTLATHTLHRINTATNRFEEIKIDYIAEADLSGNVKVKRGEELIAADAVKTTFDPPTEPGMFGERMHSLDAHGNVVMHRGQDHVTCTGLIVLFGRDPAGDTIPRYAEAVENVVVTQGTRTIAADDFVNLEMAPFVQPRPPFDPVAVRRKAMARGLDPAEIDIEAARRKHESDIDYTTGLIRLSAEGDVTATDPTEDLELAAEALTCDFADGRKLRAAHLVGPDAEPALVRLADFSVEAHEMDVDLDTERVDVVGEGALSFVTYRGLDGSRSEMPQDVTVSWLRGMTFRGDRNAARFNGEVHAATSRRFTPAPTLLTRLGLSREEIVRETSSFDADELLIDFAETEPAAQSEDPPSQQWWIFTPLARRWEMGEPDRTIAFDKEPIYVLASRDVVGLFTNTDVETGRIRNRVRIEAQKLALDLRSELMTVPGAGTLLIEDYQADARANDEKRSSNRLFGRAASGLPSQSLLQWERSMSFHYGMNRADFREDVKLFHRTGDQMAFAAGLMSPDAEPDAAVRKTPGRRTQLECESLVAEFAGRDGAPQDRRSAGRLSVDEIRQLDATGDVLLLDDDITIAAHRIVKFPQSDLLRVFGLDNTPAEIYGTKPGSPRFKGPEFSYNLVTGQIEAAGRHQFEFTPAP